MALVSGQTYFSAASYSEPNIRSDSYNTQLLTSTSSAEDSDEEYVYVSSLAEQIAYAMLEEEEDLTTSSGLSHSASSNQQYMEHGVFLQWKSKESAWPSLNTLKDQGTRYAENTELSSKGCSVSRFAAAWRDHGPSEWDCFYTPSLQQASRHLPSYYTTQLTYGSPKHCHMIQGGNPARLAFSKQDRSCNSWFSQSQKSHETVYNNVALTRKESIGTGVFLPKIVHSGSRYQRKSGSVSSKSVYAPRSKC